MIIHNVPQRTEEWYQIRLGKITGSDAAKLTPNAVKRLAMKKVAEILTGKPDPGFTTAATDHGIEYEDLVLGRIDRPFERPGFVEFDKFSGCSPDGLGEDFVVEVKCPYKPTNFINILVDTPIEYRRQIQYQMWVCEREQCIFAFYHKDFTPDIVLRYIPRDEKMIATIVDLVDKTKGLIREYLDAWSRYEAIS